MLNAPPYLHARPNIVWYLWCPANDIRKFLQWTHLCKLNLLDDADAPQSIWALRSCCWTCISIVLSQSSWDSDDDSWDRSSFIDDAATMTMSYDAIPGLWRSEYRIGGGNLILLLRRLVHSVSSEAIRVQCVCMSNIIPVSAMGLSWPWQGPIDVHIEVYECFG